MSQIVIIGGGFFGARLALELGRGGDDVLLLEREPSLLSRASFHNQARVHNGYHYPRSVLTALRSRLHFGRFVDEYGDCIDDGFTQLYAVGRTYSKLSAAQFRTFCQRIGGDIAPAPPELARLFDPNHIEAAFVVKECALDADKLRRRLDGELDEAGVHVLKRCEATRLQLESGRLRVEFSCDGVRDFALASRVYHCVYSRMNQLLSSSGLPAIPLKHELAEMALVEMPPLLRGLGVTVMDGPFFSTMPFPARGLHTLSHVRYTPHHAWLDGKEAYLDPYAHLATVDKRSHFPQMVRDARRYLPALEGCAYRDSLWEVKTVLPSSEQDDSRPILFARDHGVPGLTCILGGKLDNIYDLLHEVRADKPRPEVLQIA